MTMRETEYIKMHATEDQMWWFQSLRAFMLKVLPAQHSHALTAFDIGCGTGRWVQELADQGYKTFGIDYAAKGIELASKRNLENLAVADANYLPVRNQQFDLVTCVDVLEVSSVNPQALVSNALRVLKPGGHALFVMAAHQWLLSEHDRAVNSVRRYSLKELTEIFPEDVEIIRATYLFFLVFPLTMTWKLLNGRKTKDVADSDVVMPHPLMNRLLIIICKIEEKLLGRFNMPTGSSVLVLVRKS